MEHTVTEAGNDPVDNCLEFTPSLFYTLPMNRKNEQLYMDIHPNAYIAGHTDLQELFCVYCDSFAAEEASSIVGADKCKYNGGCILLFTGKKQISKLEALFRRLESHAGICGPFARALSAYGCAEKAYTAVKLGSELNPTVYLHRYADSRLWAFVELADEIITGSKLSINDFCHNSVFDICEYDRLEKSSYRITLMAYLRAGCNLRESAEAIGVHRNTMAYRKKRLEELFHIDLNDSNTCFELLFSFIALEAAGIAWDDYQKPQGDNFDAAVLSRALWQLAEHRPLKDLPNCICRLCMIDASGLQDDQIARIFCDIENKFPDAAAAYNDSSIYLLTPNDDMYLDKVLSVLTDAELCSAVSQPFLCSKLNLHAELLSYILPIAKNLYPNDSLFMSKDYCSLAFFSYMQHRTSLEPYYCDEVIRVMDHDYKKGTTFSRSFYTYLSSFMDMIGAAHEASVHRNTLEYQIKKALSIANVGTPDDQLRFEMLCTYKMLLVSGT